MKLHAITELEETTTKGCDLIKGAMTTALDTLQSDYNKIVAKWDATKFKLDREAKLTIDDMQKEIDEKSSIAYRREQLLSIDVTQTKATITSIEEQLAFRMDKVSLAVITAIYDATDAALARAIDKHMRTLDDIFKENMGLMDELYSSYYVNTIFHEAEVESINNIKRKAIDHNE